MFVSFHEFSCITLLILLVVELLSTSSMWKRVFEFSLILILFSIHISSFPLKLIINEISFIKRLCWFDPSPITIFLIIKEVSFIVEVLISLFFYLFPDSSSFIVHQISLVVNVMYIVSINSFRSLVRVFYLFEFISFISKLLDFFHDGTVK